MVKRVRYSHQNFKVNAVLTKRLLKSYSFRPITLSEYTSVSSQLSYGRLSRKLICEQ